MESGDGSGASRYAIATSEDEAQVIAIDLETHAVAARLPAGPTAHALAVTRDGSRVYVVNRRGASLTVVDARSLTVVATIALAADPMGAAVSPDGRWLAVLARAELRAWVFDAATGALRHEVPLGEALARGGSAAGPCSTHPVWAPDGRHFYAQDNPHAALVQVDAERGAVAATTSLPSPAHMMYVDAARARVYALCVGDAERGAPPAVAVVDPAGSQVLATLPIPLAEGESGELHHATFDAEGKRLFVANMGEGRPRGGRSVHVLDLDALALVARLEAGPGAGHPVLSPDGAQLWVVNHSSPVLSVFEVETLRGVGEVRLPDARGMGHGCFFSGGGRHFWAVSNTAGAAYVVDARSLAVVAHVPTGANCQDIAHHWHDAYA